MSSSGVLGRWCLPLSSRRPARSPWTSQAVGIDLPERPLLERHAQAVIGTLGLVHRVAADAAHRERICGRDRHRCEQQGISSRNAARKIGGYSWQGLHSRRPIIRRSRLTQTTGRWPLDRDHPQSEVLRSGVLASVGGDEDVCAADDGRADVHGVHRSQCLASSASIALCTTCGDVSQSTRRRGPPAGRP